MLEFMRDWRRWTPVERIVAVVLLGLLFALPVLSRGAS